MKPYRYLFPIVSIAFGTALPAHAENSLACNSVNEVFRAVAVHQNIRYEYALKSNVTALFSLEKIVQEVEPNFYLTNLNPSELKSEVQIIMQYLIDLEENILYSRLNSSLNGFSAPPPSNLLTSLESVGQYWGCSLTNETAGFSEVSSQKQTKYRGAQTQKNGQSTYSSRTPEVKNIPRISGQRGGENASRLAFRSVELQQRKAGWLMSIGILTLILGTFVFQRRERKHRKREERTYIQLPIKLRLESTDYLVYLADISMNGAKVKHDEVLMPNDKIHVEIRGHWHAGQVKWSNDVYAGLMFKRPVNEETLKSITSS